MAFNPFHGFRKHKKVFFAALTIMCMITFVLSGASGFFQEWMHLLGGGRDPSPPAATLYGKQVYSHEIMQLRTQRDVANSYILSAKDAAIVSACRKALDEVKKRFPDKSQQDKVSTVLQGIVMTHGYIRDPQMAQFRGFILQQVRSQYDRYLNDLRMLDPLRQEFDPTKKTAESEFIKSVQDLVIRSFSFLGRSSDMYFGGSPDAKDLIDFMIWRHQADRLGIQLTGKEVGELIRQETQKSLLPGDSAQILQVLQRQHQGVNQESLSKALADEFRVRLTQQTLLGAELGERRPSPMTPYEFWNFYQTQRTENDIALLPIPVRRFFDKVGTPTEEELKALYEKNKDRLYNPGAEEAGFKQPARMKVEWVTAREDMPLYRQRAKEFMAAIQFSMPLAHHLALLNQYNPWQFQFLAPSWTSDLFLVHDSNLPPAIGALVAQTVGAGGTMGPAALSGLAGYQNVATAHEAWARARMGMSLVLSGSSGSILTPLTLAANGTPKSQYLPLERVKSFIANQVQNKLAHDLVSTTLTNLEDELRTRALDKPEDMNKKQRTLMVLGQTLALAGSPGVGILAPAFSKPLEEAHVRYERSRVACGIVFGNTSRTAPLTTAALTYRDENSITMELKAKVAQAIDRFGLEHGATTQLRDEYDIGEDPGLAPLKKAFVNWPDLEQREALARPFPSKLANSLKGANLYAPHRLQEAEGFVFWKTGERGESVPPFAEVAERVKERWKLEKARKFAEEEARRVAGKVPRNTEDELTKAWLRDASPVADKLIDLDRVARLVRPRSVVPSRAGVGTYSSYQVPAGRIEYPAPDMADKLLSLKDLNESIVVADKPKAVYYVAVLVRRTTPYPDTFFVDARENPDQQDSLYSWHEKDSKFREHKRESCLNELRAQAHLTIDEENLKGLAPRRQRDQE